MTGAVKPTVSTAPHTSPDERGRRTATQAGTDILKDGEHVTSMNGLEDSGRQQQNAVQDSKALRDASGRPSEDVNVLSYEQVDAIKSALRPKNTQQGKQKGKSKGFWGSLTDYITGADKLIQ